MSRSSRRYRALRIASLLLAHVPLCCAATPGVDAMAVQELADAQQTLFLDVVMNGTHSRELLQFELVGGRLHARAGVLHTLGFRLEDVAPGDPPIDLASLPGVRVDYDAARQRVAIDAELRLLDLETTVLNTPHAPVPEVTTSPGALVNYDLYASVADGGQRGLSGFGELRLFGAAGVFSHSMLARATDGGEGSDHGTVRLDTTWSMSLPARMLTLRVGDTVTRAPDWARPTYIGGVQLSRDFALQPYRLTMPLPAFVGEANAPSAIDLYVDGMRQFSGNLAAGPFQLNALPSVSGSGMARVVLTDALGRVTSFDFPFYATPQLLQGGLDDWSAELGFVRRDRGVDAFDYAAQPVASGLYRRGVSDRLTVEAHVEGGDGVVLAGGGANLATGLAGVASFAYARSHADGLGDGGLSSLGWSMRQARLQFAVQGTYADSRYRDIASGFGRPPPRVSERALFGVDAGRAGHFGTSYARLRYAGEEPARYASVYWTRALGRAASLNLSVNRNLDDTKDSTVFLGITLGTRRGIQVGSTVQHTDAGTTLTADATRSIPGDGGFGWRVQGRTGGASEGGAAEAGWRTTWGQVIGGINAVGDSRYGYASLSGAFAMLGGHTFAARRIDDAFAVVSTGGVAGVPVLLENREIGRTDDDGMLLVTPLNAYQGNQIAISPLDLPADQRVEDVARTVTPARGTGTHVRFEVRGVSGVSVVLHDAQGAPVALGSRVRRDGGAEAMVGYDGMTWLEDLPEQATLQVETPTGSCTARIDRRAATSPATLGPIPCL